jgi:hypothetical protein
MRNQSQKSFKSKKRGVGEKLGGIEMRNARKAGRDGIKNKRNWEKPFTKVMALALIAAISMLCLAPALFAEQIMLPKDIGSKCGNYSLTSNSDYADITDYGGYSAPELVDYDADGQLELVVGYQDGDIRSFQYNETASPKWQLDEYVLDETSAYKHNRKISAVDFDKDGDYDIISALDEGEVEYFENYGTRTAPNWTLNRGILHVHQEESSDDVNGFADVVDFDSDGDYDILAGKYYSNGTVDFYENVADEYAMNFKPFTSQFLDDIGSYTQCAFIDIDDEGVLDMICSRNSQTLYKFENKGNTTEAEWGDVEIFLNTSSGSQKYFSFGDLDNDTDYDLMIGDDGGNVYYYENTGTRQNPLFSSGTDALGGSLGTYTAPSLADFDGDGDLDMYVGEENSNSIRYYNNTGNATDYTFTLTTAMEIAVAADRPVPHAVDIDNDGDYDLAVGISDGNVRLYNNTGTAQSPSFSSYASLIDLGDYAGVGFGDIDNDNDLDMAVGNSKGYCLFYYNSGNSTHASINSTIDRFYTSFVPSDDFNEFMSIDLVDFDFDGDHDLIVGRKGGADAFDASVFLYENKGTDLNPDFEPEPPYNHTAKWADLSDTAGFVYSAFGDLDNDGDLDMLLNEAGYDGRYIQYYENVGNEFSYNWSDRVEDYLGINVGTYSVPDAVDFDLDGDYDILIGNSDGKIRYARNDGNITDANFTDMGYLNSTSGGNIDVGEHSCPAAADMDADGDIDLIIGDRVSLHTIGYWQNNGSGYFTLDNNDILGGKVGGSQDNPCPALADLDGDGDYDMIIGVGTGSGGIYMVLNTGTNQSPSWGSHQGMIVDDHNTFWDTQSEHGFLQENVVPALYDLKNDSIIDIVAGDGREYYMNRGAGLMPFKHYTSNTSTILERVWGSYNGEWQWWTPSWDLCVGCDLRSVAPAFADLDANGYPDLIIGRQGGNVEVIWNYGKLADNTSIMRNMAWIPKTGDLLGGSINSDTYYYGMDIGLYDIDNDNDLDVLVWIGRYSNSVLYTTRLFLIRNQGTASSYSFNPDDEELLFNQYRMDCATENNANPNPGDMQMLDFDNDGDIDISLGTLLYYSDGYREGKKKLLINNGTVNNPSFQELIAGDQDGCYSDNLLPYNGLHPSSAFFDADNDSDYDALLCATYRGYCLVLENTGIYTDPADLDDYSRFIKTAPDLLGDIFPTTNPSYNLAFRATDFDGDGDYDIILTSEQATNSEKLRIFENTGTNEEPNFAETTIIADLGSSIVSPVPAVGDIDNDGDNDIIYGYSTGILGAYKNTGEYQNNTCITVVNSSLVGEPGATVTFKNSSGATICTAATGANGRAECNIGYNEGEIQIFVSGMDNPYKILVSSYADSGRSSTNAEFDVAGISSKIALNRMLFSVYSPGDYTGTVAKVDISDSNQTMFSGITNSSGILNAWLPKKYIIFRNEPYTQNRITYNIEVFANDDYDRVLTLEDVYTPNEINLSSAAESRKLYKFPATEDMATGSRYRVHVIYPAYTAQQKYNITDTVNGNLTIVSDVTVSYAGESCTVTPASNSYSVDYTDAGCDFLEDAVEGNGEWVKVDYIIETPSLATFESEGWSTQDFVSDPATIRLIS